MLLSVDRQTFAASHEYTRDDQFALWTLEVTTSGVMRRRAGPVTRLRRQPNHTLILSPPHHPYTLRGELPGDELWALFEPRAGIAEHLDWPPGEFGVPSVPLAGRPEARELLRALADAHEWFLRRTPRALLLAENALERALLVTADLAAQADMPMPDDRIQACLAYLESAWRQPLQVEDLARLANLSPSRFAHLFREQTGRSPMTYVEDLRLGEAQRLLLRSDLPVKRIAWEVGYQDPAYFSARFRRRHGQSPHAWRNNPQP